MMRSNFRVWMLVFCLGIAGVHAGEPLSFISKPLTAGKASLTENGFFIPQNLGVANFSPDLRFPIQLIYNSSSEKTGIFGYAWSSPQLQSCAIPEKDGVLWTAPWGEKIKFFAKEKADKETLELYKEEMKGRGFFAPYADWEASTAVTKDKAQETGDWTFSGKRGYEGWKFIYRDAMLKTVCAPSGRSISFSYSRGLLTGISQDNQAFVEISYDENLIRSISINGVERKLSYESNRISILPKTQQGNIIAASRPQLKSLQTGELNPVMFSYDDYGYLTKVQKGDFIDELKVETETLAERINNLKSAYKSNNIAHNGKVAGRLLSDSFFTYSYGSFWPDKITLTDKLDRTASYDFNKKTGIFKISEFSGKSYTIYYFMRYDVAYLGKVRQIVDWQDRVVVNYRYDKLTGQITRIRDMAENDINFTYDNAGNLSLVSRRAADQDDSEPVRSFSYDRRNNPVTISLLDENGKAAVNTRISYNSNNQPTRIDNGRTTMSMQYNRFGYPGAVTDVFNRTRRMDYDKFNRLNSVTDFYGVKAEYTFNSSGLITGIARKDPASGEVLTSLSIIYNGNGQPISYTDQSGRTKKFERDAFGRVVKEFFPDETSVEYSYNAIGKLDTVLDQNRHEIKFDWSKFGLEAKITAAGQLTDYVYDKYGMLAKIDSKQDEKTDRTIKYEYDNLDRLVKVNYSNGETETFTYDTWGKLLSSTRGDKKAVFKYDYFGRMIEKSEDGILNTYTYNAYGQRTGRITRNGSVTLSEKRTYDKYGRLIEIGDGSKAVRYSYDNRNQLKTQIADDMPIDFSYTKYGQLESKTLGGLVQPIATLKYIYSKDGMIAGRVVNGKFQMYSYDKKGQLLSVADMQGNVAEAYKYDPAGNILEKTVNGKTTTYTFDKANQLVTSVTDGKTTRYAYDAAGRLVKEGDKTYTYGYLDKILSVQEDGKQTAAFDYHVDGQIARATYTDKQENFLWDGLSLISRNQTSYINEPYVTGGNPLLSSSGEVMFNDMLGTTLGSKSGDKFDAVNMTAFGERVRPAADLAASLCDAAESAFFTGKPAIGELGYAFLFRNYRSDQGKWSTSDPLGYPDGWNNLAYVNNSVTMSFDWLGAKEYVIIVPLGSYAAPLDETEELMSTYWKNMAAHALEVSDDKMTIIEARDTVDARKQLESYVEDNGAISHLIIAGHGTNGQIFVGPHSDFAVNSLVSLDCSNAEALFSGLSFAENSIVDLYACNAGLDYGPMNLLEIISSITGGYVCGSSEPGWTNGEIMKINFNLRYKNGVKE